MKNGIIIKNIADLRAKPNFRSERKSQLLFNEPVKIEKYRNGYYRVVQPDGYFGWVSENTVKIISKTKLKDYLTKKSYIVKSKTARIYSANSKNASFPDFIFYGTDLFCSSVKNNNCISKDTDGNSFSISNNNLISLNKIKTPIPSVIIKEAKRFMGVPYLWGGISPFGFDCSGFARMIFRRFNIYLPRDSHEQYKYGQKINIDNIKPADLLFFKGHVALSIGRAKFIHASLGAGGVVINTLKTDDVGFRKDLYDTYLGARRLLP